MGVRASREVAGAGVETVEGGEVGGVGVGGAVLGAGVETVEVG